MDGDCYSEQRLSGEYRTVEIHAATASDRVMETRQDRFSYVCNRCRRCCHHKLIRVNPYEIARLARNQGRNVLLIPRFRADFLKFPAKFPESRELGERAVRERLRPPPVYMGPTFSGSVQTAGLGPTREPARAIEGGRFHANEPLSASVAQAAHHVAVRIRGEIEGSNHYFASVGGSMPDDASLAVSVRATPRCSAPRAFGRNRHKLRAN